MFNKFKGKLRLTDIFSNEIFQLTLEELDWEHAESKNHAWEFFKLKGLEEKSVFLAILLRTIGHNLKFGDYVYTRKSADLLERSSPLIKKTRKESKLFSIEKVFRQPKPTGRVQVLND